MFQPNGNTKTDKLPLMIKVLSFCRTMNEDDAEFKPNQSTSSNLTSLFDANKLHPSDNQSLTYTAPKAPKTGESSATLKQSSSRSSSSEKLKIINSKTVQAYKLENGNYVNQGSVGIAIIGNYSLHLYQIILYRNNKDYLCKIHITPTFSFTVLENNYASFYDNSKQNWSILFSSSSNISEFAKHVAIAIYNSQINHDKVLVQDLAPAGGVKAKGTDALKVSYSCNVLQNDEVVPFEEKKTVTVQLNDANHFSWHEGLRDCSEHCKRVVIIPYKLSAPWTNSIKPNTSVLLELEVESILSSDSDGTYAQAQKEKTKPNEADKTTKIQEESATDSSGDENPCKGKLTSLKDSIFLSRSHKSNLISRIAKVGQALPLKGAFLSAPSDSEDECTSLPRHGNKLRAINNAVQQFHQTVPMHLRPCSPQADDPNHGSPHNQICKYEIDVSWQQQKMRSGINVACQQLHPYTTAPPASKEKASEQLQNFDSKAVDPELRITINKVSEKVDHVLNKLQSLDSSNWDKLKEHQSATVMDPVNVISSIQGVITENENLKTEIQLQQHKIDEQNRKIQTLTDLTRRCVEKCSMPEGKQSVVAGTIVDLEEQLRNSSQFMSEANARINQLTSDVEKHKGQISDNQRLIRESNAQVFDLLEKLKEKESMIHDLEAVLSRTVAENEALISLSEEQKKEILHYKSADGGETSSSSKIPSHIPNEDSFEEIKKVMNAVNKKLQSYFESDRNYSGGHVKEIIATTIKDVTVEYLRYKSKLRSSSKIDLNQREISKTAFESSRTERIQPEPGPPSRIIQNLDSERYTGQRKSSEITKVTPHRLTFVEDHESQIAKVRDKLEEVRVTAEPKKLQSNEGEMVTYATPPKSPRPSPELSGVTQFSKSSEVARHDSGSSASDGRKSRPQIIKEPGTSQTRRPTFVDENLGPELYGSFSETVRATRETRGPLGSTTTDTVQDSSTRSFTSRSGDVVPDSESIRVSREEPSAESKTLIRYELDENVENENSDMTVRRKVSSAAKREISLPSSQRSESMSAHQASSKSTSDYFSAFSEVGITAEDEEVNDLKPAISSSTVSDLTKGSVQTSSRKSALKTGYQNSRLDANVEENSLGVTSGVKVSSETGKIHMETEQSARNLNKEISQEIRKASSEQPSFRSIPTVRGQSSGLDKRFVEDNLDYNARTSINEEEGVENVEIEKLAVNLSKTASDVTKSTLIQPLSRRSTSAVKADNSGMDENLKHVASRDESGRSIGAETIEPMESEKSTLTVNKTASDVTKSPTVAASAYSRRSTLKNKISEMDKNMKDDDLGTGSRIGIIDEEEGIENFEIERSAVILSRTSDIAGTATRPASVDAVKTQSSRMSKSVRADSSLSGNAITPTVVEESVDSEVEKHISLTQTMISNATRASDPVSHMSVVTEIDHRVKEDNATNRSVKTSMEKDTKTGSAILNRTKSNVTAGVESQRSSAPAFDKRASGVESLRPGSGTIAAENVNEGAGREDNGTNVEEFYSRSESKSVEEEVKDEENDEIEGNCLEGKENCASQENVKSSGSNAVNDSCLSPDYYWNWGLSKPPPLPLDDEDTSDNDGEWL